MLYTNLNHIESVDEYTRILNEHENVIIICGRMDSVCISVYRLAVELDEEYGHVKFFDMEYDNPESYFFYALPEVSYLREIPFTVYYKNGQVIKATSGIQSKAQMKAILDQEFPAPINVE